MKAQRLYLIACLACALPLPGAFGADLSPPFCLENADVLPVGVRNPRFVDMFLNVDQKFDGAGARQALGAPLNKRISWGDVISSQDQEADRAVLRGLLRDRGFTESGSPGSTSGAVTSFADVKVPALAVGLTEKWTLAVAVPIYKVQINADSTLVKSDEGQKVVDSLAGDKPYQAAQVASKLNDAVNQKLTRMGYDPISSFTTTALGDVRIIGKYQIQNTGVDAVAIKPMLTLPTGVAPNPDKAIDVPTGDGQTDAGIQVLWDHVLATGLKLNTYAGYNFQFGDQIMKRIPVSADDSLSPDKELVNRKLGDEFNTGFGFSQEIYPIGMILGAGYNFQYQQGAAYSGSKFSSDRYRLLEALSPAQVLHTGIVTAGFSTIHWYKEKKFFYPMQANLAYTQTLAGWNVTDGPCLSAELVLFF